MDERKFWEIVTPYTVTSEERIRYLYRGLEHLRQHRIAGDYVECGVWRGGNIRGILHYLEHHKSDSCVWLYDTFCGMTPPTELDVTYHDEKADEFSPPGDFATGVEEVKAILSSSSYSKIRFVVGDVCKTLKIETNLPEQIALLRLDTDYYESTKVELEVLWPRLVKGGVLIVDDYGWWKGCKKAVDDFFKGQQRLEAIDFTGVGLIKC